MISDIEQAAEALNNSRIPEPQLTIELIAGGALPLILTYEAEKFATRVTNSLCLEICAAVLGYAAGFSIMVFSLMKLDLFTLSRSSKLLHAVDQIEEGVESGLCHLEGQLSFLPTLMGKNYKLELLGSDGKNVLEFQGFGHQPALNNIAKRSAALRGLPTQTL